MQIDKLAHDSLVSFMHETTMSNPTLPLLSSSPDFVFPSLTRELDIRLII